MLLPLYQQPFTLPPKTLSPHSLPAKILASQYPKTPKKPRKEIFLIRSSIQRTGNQTLPQSAIQRIADKLRSLGFSETQNPEPESEPGSGSDSPGEIFVPLPEKIPKYRVGHTIDTSWSTPENPVPDPGSAPGSLMTRFRDMKRERRKVGRVKDEERAVPSLAELKLSAAELRRLRTVGIGEKRKLKLGKAGITEGIVNGIHERWRRSEVVKIVCEDICKMNMKRTHEVLERKTGGLVVWRSGSKIILYRGANYRYPYFLADKIATDDTSSNASPDTNMDNVELHETESCSSEINSAKTAIPNATNKMTKPIVVQGVGSPSRVRFQLPGEAELVEEADRLLDGLGPRFTDWWGYEPLPVDGDLLPAIIPGYRRPFRLLPYGVKPILTNDEMTTLRRLGRPLPCHFVLGRNRKLQGLAASIVKLWEKCEITKVAIKRGVQNTNSELMAEELKWLTGGTLLARDKDFIVLYRGKDFLPSAVSSAIEERRRHVIHVEKQGAECSKSKKTAQEVIVEDTKSGSESKINSAKDQRSNFFVDPKNMKSAEAAIRKTDVKLSMALEKKAKAEKLLAELEQAQIPQQYEIDKEGITQEERYMLRKVGLRMKPFLLLGRRGVFDGTVENMHLHWKYRELVKIISKETNVEAVHQLARMLEAESGGILMAVERVSKGYAIIVYRGKNYERPTCLRPQTLLTKRQAMKRSLEEQRRKSLKLHILKLTRNIDELKHQLVVDKEANSMQTVEQSSLPLVQEEMETLQSVEYTGSVIECPASPGGHVKARDKDGSESTSMKNDKMVAAIGIRQPSKQELMEPSSIHDGFENHKTESEFSAESVNRQSHATELRALNAQVEMVDTSYPDNLMEEIDYSGAINAKHGASKNGPMESLVESASMLDVSISSAVENMSNKMGSTANFLSNKDRLLLRKQALKMKKRPVLAVGRSNIVTGVAKAIKAHFRKHPLAIVNVKGRAKGTSVQEVVLKLQEATGAFLVSQEPSKVILYRGWGAGDELGRGDNTNAKDLLAQNQPAVSPELIAAIRLECGLQLHQEQEAT
ncbi:CRM-domain containing factor CFM2, chloroplastic [Herrania umbratica]|uniref:CRM-domain containing factor CFM2, chloroplastic n=1 Tax=Herrania umbratica TaxID=108875 RepID=A0A6J1BIF4_9ROSI|nr:CRM-domain containing factor CFM2, chloroplastic [Herrania umbratica]XP_021299251.1 CRM-domain containing factor CFM2, chloroplastic [Herrania umbratica]